jgi:CRP-like cAMP-binding protein
VSNIDQQIANSKWQIGTDHWVVREINVVEERGIHMAAAKDVFNQKHFLARVGAGKQILEFHKNQHVFEQGDVADTVFYIQKGKVKLTVLSEHGKEAVVAILEPGQFFGEGCMNGHKLRISTTTAMEDCVVTAITKEAMLAGNFPRCSWRIS